MPIPNQKTLHKVNANRGVSDQIRNMGINQKNLNFEFKYHITGVNNDNIIKFRTYHNTDNIGVPSPPSQCPQSQKARKKSIHEKIGDYSHNFISYFFGCDVYTVLPIKK